MRYCNKCQCWKPDRTHHCSSCRKCILRMDHHCPWFATCIGFRNQKFFLLFLFYVSLFCITCCIGSVYAIANFIYRLPDLEKNPVVAASLDRESVYLPLSWIALGIVSTVMGLAVSLFAAYSI